MHHCAVMESAFVGAIRGIRDRIDVAVAGNEVWSYQLGDSPRYVGKHSIIDDDMPTNDSIVIDFYKSPWDVYDYRLRIKFFDVDGIIDVMVMDVDLTDGRFNVMPDYSVGEDPATSVQMVDGDPFIFYPVEDICTILSAMSFITVGEVLAAEKKELLAAEAEARQIRRKRFSVIEGSKES